MTGVSHALAGPDRVARHARRAARLARRNRLRPGDDRRRRTACDPRLHGAARRRATGSSWRSPASRGSLARLRADPRVALTVLAGPDLAFTAHGTAAVVADPLPGAEAVAAVAITRPDAVRRHERPTFAIEAGVAWRWTDAQALERDGAVRAALLALPRA